MSTSIVHFQPRLEDVGAFVGPGPWPAHPLRSLNWTLGLIFSLWTMMLCRWSLFDFLCAGEKACPAA